MAEHTSASIMIEAEPATIMAVIADFPAYPRWATAVRSVEVLETGENGRASKVGFELNTGVLKDEYSLLYTWDRDREVRWTLAEGKVLKALDGAYTLRDKGRGHTEVTYRLAVDVSIPMIGMLKRKAEKMIIETALDELKKQVESAREAPEA